MCVNSRTLLYICAEFENTSGFMKLPYSSAKRITSDERYLQLFLSLPISI